LVADGALYPHVALKVLPASASDSYVFGYKLLLTSLFIVSGLQ
jgi:hypothetical protein